MICYEIRIEKTRDCRKFRAVGVGKKEAEPIQSRSALSAARSERTQRRDWRPWWMKQAHLNRAADVASESRLCENSQELEVRRIVFSIRFFRWIQPNAMFFRSGEIEKNLLRLNRVCEFLHSLDPKATSVGKKVSLKYKL